MEAERGVFLGGIDGDRDGGRGVSENGIGLLTVFCWLLSDGHAATFVGSMYADSAGSGRNAHGEISKSFASEGRERRAGRL